MVTEYVLDFQELLTVNELLESADEIHTRESCHLFFHSSQEHTLIIIIFF